jgi:hypothetical protein
MNRIQHAHRLQAPVRPDNRPESAPGIAGNAPADPEAVRRKRLAQIPVRQRPIFLRAWTGKSRKAALRAFCLECVGYESAEVNCCTTPACPLYEYREGRL